MPPFTLLAWPMIAKGMEVSLLFNDFGLFTYLLIGDIEGRRGPLAVGAAAMLCIGAHIDTTTGDGDNQIHAWRLACAVR